MAVSGGLSIHEIACRLNCHVNTFSLQHASKGNSLFSVNNLFAYVSIRMDYAMKTYKIYSLESMHETFICQKIASNIP